MKAQSLEPIVRTSTQRLPKERIEELVEEVRAKTPAELVEPSRMSRRRARLAEAEVQPSPTAQERLLGTNDLVDVSYLRRAIDAARAVCRVVLRDRTGREIGYATGFKVAPRLLLTNHHVLETGSVAAAAQVEFDYELSPDGSQPQTTRFLLDPRSLFLSDEQLDFALVAIASEPVSGSGRLLDYGFLRLVRDEGKINTGEFVTIIQHPSGQPKQIALRENKLLSIENMHLWYQSDTAQGSSGAPAFNDSWQIVALHHSGVPKTDADGHWLLKNGLIAGPDAEDGDIDWIANEGIRVSRIVGRVYDIGGPSPYLDEFRRASSGELPVPSDESDRILPTPPLPNDMPRAHYEPVPGGARLTIPVTFSILVDGLPRAGVPLPSQPRTVEAPDVAPEKMKKVYIDRDYDSRQGYDPEFLGIEVPLPDVRDETRVARMDDGQHVLPYQNFSLVMDKERRLALFTASNVDARHEIKEPELGRDYSRRGLSGLGQYDIEEWSTDPRIPESHQLPDLFFTEDDKAFDKGHLARREAVAWGESYDAVRRANGDSYHTTNCSPQVKEFNRGQLHGLWGMLEDVVLDQAETEKLSVFSGPLLQAEDRIFVGKDEHGPVRVQIPSVYWKIVVARAGDQLQSFGFVLEQDLSNVSLEFAVEAPWIDSMIPIDELEGLIGNVRFPDVLVDADQYETDSGAELYQSEELMGIRRAPQFLRRMEAARE